MKKSMIIYENLMENWSSAPCQTPHFIKVFNILFQNLPIRMKIHIVISIKQKILALMKIGKIYVRIYLRAPIQIIHNKMWYNLSRYWAKYSQSVFIIKFPVTQISRKSSAGRAQGLWFKDCWSHCASLFFSHQATTVRLLVYVLTVDDPKSKSLKRSE